MTANPDQVIEKLGFVADAIKPIKGLEGMSTTVREAIALLRPAAGGEAVSFEFCWLVEFFRPYGGPSLGRYHPQGDPPHIPTDQPQSAQRYASHKDAAFVASRLDAPPDSEWRAVEHGFERHPAPAAREAVGEDYVLVPREPTPEMLRALMEEWDSTGTRTMVTNYRAMLAAAPPPQANGPDYSDGCDSEGFPGGCARMGHTPETCPQAKPVSSQYRDQRVRENVQRVADILHPQAKPPCADPHISEVCGNADKAKPQEGECPVCHKAWGEHRSGYSASQCKHTPPAAPADEGREVDWSERAAWCAQSILLLLGHVESRRDHHGTSIGHYRWMAEELAAKRVGSATKACRWLGYLQGGLVHAGYTTLEAEKQRNLDSLKVEGR